MRETVKREDASAWPALVEQGGAGGVRDRIAGLQPFGIAVVIVDAKDVGCRRFPAVVADHGPRGVKRPRQVVQRFDGIAVCLDGRQVGHAP